MWADRHDSLINQIISVYNNAYLVCGFVESISRTGTRPKPFHDPVVIVDIVDDRFAKQCCEIEC
jgi:hypothetical protein